MALLTAMDKSRSAGMINCPDITLRLVSKTIAKVLLTSAYFFKRRLTSWRGRGLDVMDHFTNVSSSGPKMMLVEGGTLTSISVGSMFVGQNPLIVTTRATGTIIWCLSVTSR